MAYSAEIVRRARSRLAAAREDKQSQAAQKREQAYLQCPRLKEIDLELRKTMAQAAQAAFLQGDGGMELLEKAKTHNQALQKERSALLESQFPKDFLDESPVCPTCGGSGYIGSQMCRCLQEMCRQEQQKELAVLSGNADGFSQFRLDYYSGNADPRLGASPRDVMSANLYDCRKYASFFTPQSGNLLFIGGTGLGKTFLSGCIAKTVTDRGYSVVYEPAGRLFSNLESVRFNPTEDSRKAAESYQSCDLLILDDLGTELPGQFITAALYSLLNDRLLAGKPMLISTNLTVDELGKRYSAPIVSRLRGEFTRMTFVGEDIRLKKGLMATL